MSGARYQTNNKEIEYFLTHTAVGSLDSRTQLLYQSKEFMSDFGFNLQDFDARLFDSQLGRWHAIDPVTQFASPYVGMGNNPVSLTDPDGRQVSHGGGGKLPKRNMRKKHLYDADDLSERGGYYYQPWDQIEIVDYYTFSVGSYNTGTFGSSIGSSGISHGSGGNGYGRAVHQSPDDLEYEISPPSDDPRPRITLTEQMQSAMLRSMNVIGMGIENGSFSESARGNVAQSNGDNVAVSAVTTVVGKAAKGLNEGQVHMYYMPRTNRVQIYPRKYVNPSMKEIRLKGKVTPILFFVNEGFLIQDLRQGNITREQFTNGTLNNVAGSVFPQYGIAQLYLSAGEWFFSLPSVTEFFVDLETAFEEFYQSEQ